MSPTKLILSIISWSSKFFLIAKLPYSSLEIGFRMLDNKIPLLSIREPYATLTLQKKKNIELRRWSAKEGNTFYIHVPQIEDKRLCKDYGITPHRPKSIIGKATITGIKYYNTPDEFAQDTIVKNSGNTIGDSY
jgi:hypothetical protein